nr:immunoglobulin heavy chain junction region [Macaca mulatta]MOX60553.1 immunoglobulin heavy chain junction region [Macaca mulatta]MOX61781.1 immunoglobulin heavy chain junction region [Macaca mulatta]MOX63931.1 immunoglobulin heavy chain junction region [Macaca mulatta]
CARYEAGTTLIDYW